MSRVTVVLRKLQIMNYVFDCSYKYMYIITISQFLLIYRTFMILTRMCSLYSFLEIFVNKMAAYLNCIFCQIWRPI